MYDVFAVFVYTAGDFETVSRREHNFVLLTARPGNVFTMPGFDDEFDLGPHLNISGRCLLVRRDEAWVDSHSSDLVVGEEVVQLGIVVEPNRPVDGPLKIGQLVQPGHQRTDRRVVLLEKGAVTVPRGVDHWTVQDVELIVPNSGDLGVTEIEQLRPVLALPGSDIGRLGQVPRMLTCVFSTGVGIPELGIREVILVLDRKSLARCGIRRAGRIESARIQRRIRLTCGSGSAELVTWRRRAVRRRRVLGQEAMTPFTGHCFSRLARIRIWPAADRKITSSGWSVRGALFALSIVRVRSRWSLVSPNWYVTSSGLFSIWL
ncbi:hypothetical protein [Nocardia vermiculata]|uniref:hypothetical protein n=1 Tax=Nocardia vermiculata TaxID=257274 RepID=UPI00083748A4|nr:hypothetical protein [Nocardia vermiculata]